MIFSVRLFGLCAALVIFVNHSQAKNVVLTDKNWKSLLDGQWLVKFYAPWCPACRSMEGTWKELASWAENEENLSVGTVDVTEQTALNGRFMVTSLPTIYFVKDGEFRVYKSGRMLNEFQSFVTQEQWRELPTVSSWTSPTSTLMSGVAKLFGFSLVLKDFHQSLNNDYGLPTWLTFLLFGLIIVVIGLLLGIVLVLVTDWFMGAPVPAYQHKKDDDLNETTEPTEDTEEVTESTESDETTVTKRNVKKE